MTAISLKNQMFYYEVRRQTRKSFCLELTAPDHLLIKAPAAMPDEEIEFYLRKKERWLLDKSNLLKANQTPPMPTSETLAFMGKQYRLALTRSFRRPTIKLAEDTLQINIYEPLAYRFPMLLERWYRQQAASYLQQRTAFWSARLGTTINRITIKDQKTRWGSCSSLGNINYNWRLILAPPEVIDYIVVHETAHRLILNHSSAFWQLVAKYCPDYRQQKEWLKAHGNTLLCFSVNQVIPKTNHII